MNTTRHIKSDIQRKTLNFSHKGTIYDQHATWRLVILVQTFKVLCSSEAFKSTHWIRNFLGHILSNIPTSRTNNFYFVTTLGIFLRKNRFVSVSMKITCFLLWMDKWKDFWLNTKLVYLKNFIRNIFLQIDRCVNSKNTNGNNNKKCSTAFSSFLFFLSYKNKDDSDIHLYYILTHHLFFFLYLLFAYTSKIIVVRQVQSQKLLYILV